MASVSKLVAFFIILIMMSLILLARFQSEDAKSVQVGRLIARGARKVLGGTMAMDSAREVPTGPDPLHHHGYPSRP